MTLNEYQEKAMKTCMPSSNNFSYMMLNLVGEVGEFASKVAKWIRKEHYHIRPHTYKRVENHLFVKTAYLKEVGIEVIDDENNELKKEAGDILWQLAGLCKVMGWNLESVAQQNLDKLASRQDRGVIDGNGDNR